MLLLPIVCVRIRLGRFGLARSAFGSCVGEWYMVGSLLVGIYVIVVAVDWCGRECLY